MLRTTIILLLVSGLLAAAEQVELQLRSGTTVRGRLISQDDTEVVVESMVATKKGAMTARLSYKRRDITSLTALPDPEEEYARRAPAAKDAAAHVALARWCREQGLATQYRAEAILAISSAPDDAEAKALIEELGLMQIDGAWKPEAEVLAAQGKVRYKGQIMTKAEAAALKAKEDQQQDTEELIGDGAAGVAACDRQLASIDRRRTQIDEDIASETAKANAARDLIGKATAAKAASDAAERTVQAALAAQAKAKAGDPAAATAVADAKRSSEAAQKSSNAAKRAAVGSERAAATHDARVAALQEELTRLAKQRDATVTKRAALAKSVEDAKAALAKPAVTP